jgi:hypothetical protein
MKGIYPYEEGDQYILQPCVGCGEPLCINITIDTVVLTANAIARMTIVEILNATTAIGAFLVETEGQKHEMTAGSWEYASRAVDKLEAFAEKIRTIAKQ